MPAQPRLLGVTTRLSQHQGWSNQNDTSGSHVPFEQNSKTLASAKEARS